jgi:2-C-methyl-D-erythritol 4-phosphate cytidylyltransferase
MLEALGVPVKVFPGERRNIKVTTAEDLEWVGALCASRRRGAS